jgi:hypothetical protein
MDLKEYAVGIQTTMDSQRRERAVGYVAGFSATESEVEPFNLSVIASEANPPVSKFYSREYHCDAFFIRRKGEPHKSAESKYFASTSKICI